MPFLFNRTSWTSSPRLILLAALALQGTVSVGEEQPQPSEDQQRLIDLLDAAGGEYSADQSGKKWELQSVDLRDATLTEELLDLLGQQQSLQNLYFYQTPLTDDGIKRLGALKDLTYLRMRSTLVTDEGLRSLGSLTSLNSLSLSNCEVTGEGLVAMSHLPLERLRVGFTGVNDDGLAAIGRITALKDLSMLAVPISDKGIAHLTRLSNLELIEMRGTIVTDAAMEHLAKLKNLRGIGLNGTLVTGPGLAHLGDLPELTSLDISRTGLRDKSLVHLFGLSNLTIIELEQSKLTQAGVRELSRVLPQLQFSGIDTLRPGDSEKAKQLLREQGEQAIAEYDRRVLEESSPRKREVIEALRRRDDRVTSYHYEWKQTQVSDMGTPDTEDDIELPQEHSVTVDGHRYASEMQGKELTQNIRISGNATSTFERRVTTSQQPASTLPVRRQLRFDGEFIQQLTEYPDSEIPASGFRQPAGRVYVAGSETWPVLAAYSTFDRTIVPVDWRRIEVADEPELVEGRPCIQLRQVQVIDYMKILQTWTIDPTRDYAIVRYTHRFGDQEPNPVMEIQHRQTDDNGWVPTSWTIHQQNGAALNVTTATVTKMELNVDTTDDEFALEFPPGVGVD